MRGGSVGGVENRETFMENGKTTIDELAVMIKEGFDGMSESMSDQFKGVSNEFSKVNTRLDKLENGQEDIKLRL